MGELAPVTPARGCRTVLTLLLGTVLTGCVTAPAAPVPSPCSVKPVRFFDLPVTHGLEDPTLEGGHGGVAVRPVSGHDGSLLRGGTVLLSEDSVGLNRPLRGELVRESPAVLRDLPAGSYWLSFAWIGYQPFITVVTVPEARVDTVNVVLYRVGICLQ